MKKSIQSGKNMLKSIFWNWQVLVLFELIYKVLGGMIVLPFLNNLINFTLKGAKIEYLNMDNLKGWIIYPLTIPILFICLLILGIYVMIEMSVMVEYFYSAKRGEKIGILQLFKSAIYKSIHILKPINWILLLFVMVLFPITTFTLTPGILTNIRIPEYVVGFIKEQGNLYLIYITILIVFEVILFYTIYSIPIFILEEQSFLKACKKSYNMIKKNFIKTLFKYLLWIVSILTIFLLACGVVLLFNIIVFRYINYSVSSERDFLLSYIQLKQYAIFILNIVIFIGNFAFIMNSYFKASGQEINFKVVKKSRINIKKVIISIAELALIVVAIGFYLDYQGNAFEMYALMNKKQEIVAHRAGSTFAPENTLEALDIAMESGADYAEIDVQQLKDGELIILHDTNFKRTTGVDKNVWDATYDEVKTYDAGSHYSLDFEGAKIPTLEEMIQRSDGKIKLMIELKRNGYEIDLEESVVKLIKKYKFENQSVIASMDLETLKKVKGLDGNIKTVYITPLAYGEFFEIDYVDMFSIEATFVNKDTVFKAHNANKKIYAWTVNKDSAIKKMLSLSIDGIVTDNPKLAEFYRLQGSRDIFIDDLVQKLFYENQ